MSQSLATVAYLGAAILFILSLGGLSNPETSRRGNLFGMVGMAIAVLATVLGPRVTAQLFSTPSTSSRIGKPLWSISCRAFCSLSSVDGIKL